MLNRYLTIGFGVLTFFVPLLPVTWLPLPDLVLNSVRWNSHRGRLAFLAMRGRPLIALMTVLFLVAFGIRTFARKGWSNG